MATLKIYSDIVGQEEKIFLHQFGLDGISYSDINEFIEGIPEDDNKIDLRIHCRGGQCVEGWAIYDALRQSGKEISATVEGECSSMATIILLAAPLERRVAYKNAHFCIHNPYVMYSDTDYFNKLTADNIDRLCGQLQKQADELRDDQERIINLYVDRTGTSREVLEPLMALDKLIGTDKAIELGFISNTLAPNTAKRGGAINTNLNNNKDQMDDKLKSVPAGKLNILLAKSGFKSLDEVRAYNLVVPTNDGGELTVEREDGEIEVGDTAYPDGTHVLDDGTTVTVEDGIVTKIVGPEGDPQPEADPEPDAKAENDENPEAEVNPEAEGENLQEKVDQLEAEKEQLEAEKEKLEAENEKLEAEKEQLVVENNELKAEVEAKRGARMLSDDEKLILAKTQRAGGIEWLNQVYAMRSKGTAPNRSFNEGHEGAKGEGEHSLAARRRAENAAKREAREKGKK